MKTKNMLVSGGGGEALSLKNQFPPPPEALLEKVSLIYQIPPPLEAFLEKTPLIKLPEVEETDF